MANDSIIPKLLEQLDSKDPVLREQAVSGLERYGSRAARLLEIKLNAEGTPDRAIVMFALVRIADSSSTAIFENALKDADPKVRAWAAQGMVKLKNPGAINALIATLHDYGNETSPFTTSAYSLIDYGVEALPSVVELLSDSNVYTREMGYDILKQIVTKMPEFSYKWNELSVELGSYNPFGEDSKRRLSAKKWKEWVENLLHK